MRFISLLILFLQFSCGPGTEREGSGNNPNQRIIDELITDDPKANQKSLVFSCQYGSSNNQMVFSGKYQVMDQLIPFPGEGAMGPIELNGKFHCLQVTQKLVNSPGLAQREIQVYVDTYQTNPLDCLENTLAVYQTNRFTNSFINGDHLVEYAIKSQDSFNLQEGLLSVHILYPATRMLSGEVLENYCLDYATNL